MTQKKETYPRHIDLKSSMDWQQQAKCKGYDTKLFFPEDPTNDNGWRHIIELCCNNSCPVKEQCHAFQNDHGYPGVWGGELFHYTGYLYFEVLENRREHRRKKLV